jgi:hypothetical protein
MGTSLGQWRPCAKRDWRRLGRVGHDTRTFLDALPGFIVTVETTRHRLFRFPPAGTRPDHTLVAIGLNDALLSRSIAMPRLLFPAGPAQPRGRINPWGRRPFVPTGQGL